MAGAALDDSAGSGSDDVFVATVVVLGATVVVLGAAVFGATGPGGAGVGGLGVVTVSSYPSAGRP